MIPLPLEHEPPQITQFLNHEWAIVLGFPQPLFACSAQWFALVDDNKKTWLMALHFPKSVYAPRFAPVEPL